MKPAVLREVGKPLQIEDVQINKPGPHEVLIRTVAAGKTYIDPAVAGLLVTPSAPSQDLVPTVELSERECEVLQRIARGHPVKQIAASLDVESRGSAVV